MLPSNVNIVEVGPRDGLQNEQRFLDYKTKAEFINKLSVSGLSNIEVGSFVSAKAIPQLTDTDQVLTSINRQPDIKYSVLVPNRKGMQKALTYKPDVVSVFTAVSEKFCQKNINCSIKESLERFSEVMTLAKANNTPVRGYISCVFGCPYEGKIDFAKTCELATELLNAGCYEVSLGDTIGIGNAKEVQQLLTILSKKIELHQLAVHFHDTYGQALVNVFAALQMGISTIDSSVAGLGGCPYAEGASGNLATEDLLYMLNGLGIESGVDLRKLVAAGHYITQQLGINPRSKVSLVYQS